MRLRTDTNGASILFIQIKSIHHREKLLGFIKNRDCHIFIYLFIFIYIFTFSAFHLRNKKKKCWSYREHAAMSLIDPIPSYPPLFFFHPPPRSSVVQHHVTTLPIFGQSNSPLHFGERELRAFSAGPVAKVERRK